MVDRNRLFNLPQNIGNLSELRTLHVRQNELTFLPESVSNCKQLKVIDLAENELLFLPSGVQNLDLRAIWLSENQNKPLVSFHEEHINLQGSGQKVLSCYLLPQKKKSAGVIIRRSIIDSDDRLYHLPMGQRNSVHFHPDFPAECESDDSSFALHRHHTPSRSMLRDFSETAKNLGAHIAKRNSMTRMEGKSDLLDLTNSIDEDEEPGDTDDDQDSTLCSQNIREERSLRSSMSSLPPNEEGINANIPGIVIPEDLIDFPKISPKVKLRKKPTCQPSFSNTSQASRHSMKEIHDAVYALEAQAVAQAPNSTPCLNASEELERTIEECNASLGQIITEMTENLQKEQIDKRESITKPVSIISSSRMTSLGGFQSYRSSIIHSTSFSSSSTFSDEEDLLYIDSDDESQEKSKSQSQPSLESQIEELATLITEKCFSEAKDLLEIEAAKREESIQQLAKTIVTSPSSTGSARSSRIQQQTFGTFWVHNSE
ncbi:Oidioi.mRNA.OKI2018_I69.XSR.g14052.t1.cds [Oikopleura dioica]|uniref:Oidioi.mRNA.OKI2018_I69.XSR.g14052.t1.cds n=1 Tax=Oikopleura dioica TaxID=34765 RepID=A0ABN7SCL4_OIKDI|nr:Oidioi.mRNA.OKI2018_I69.XSR.g14052.t1.cds [Oikopleura dioica]